MTIVHLLRQRGLWNCYHELSPDLHFEGVQFYHGRLDPEYVAERVRDTRAGVRFESNNRLFSLARPIRLALPNARFVFLHRDGRDVVRSGLQRRWYQPDDRFGDLRLGAADRGSAFQKICRYWSNINERILHDLSSMGGENLTVRFEDLVVGRGLGGLESLLGMPDGSLHRVPLSNKTQNWTAPTFDEWSPRWRREFVDICGPMMERLGYAL